MRLMAEAARLMGMELAAMPGAARRALEEAAALAAALPFHSLTRPCAFAVTGGRLFIDGTEAPGRDLARRLEGLSEGVLIGGTLGVAGDLLLKRQSLTGLTAAAAAQAALSARLEEGLDQLCREMELGRPGFCLTPRFSPGYGDLPLSFQVFLMERLQMRRLGVHLTPALMMAPVKSVTAIAGWRQGGDRAGHKCGACPNSDCAYRAKEERQ